MLYSPPPNPSATSASPVRDISGRKLRARLRKGLNPTHRALLAHELETGTVRLYPLPRRQACMLTGASVGYVATLSRLTSLDRELVKRGLLSLSALHNKPPTDADIDRLVAKLGADRIMAALDRWTRPQFRFAAE